MKISYLFILILGCLTIIEKPAIAQTPASGIISYEVMQKIDPSGMKIVINGEEVKPGSPDAPDVPDVATFSQRLFFSGDYGREERETPGPVICRMEGGPGGSQGGGREETIKVNAPFTEKKYVDMKARKYIQVLEIKKDSTTTTYQAEEPFSKTTGWQDTGKTKKIAGYKCIKATCPWKGETYIIWYTTELNFTYSPVKELQPENGVVLQIEGSGESFKASKIEAKQIPETEVKLQPGIQQVSIAQLEEMREKARADFRQKMFSAPFPR